MPFKTFTASVLSSADMNTYLMRQAVITCTSGTRPASPVQGMTIYETDTNLYATYDGTAWGYALGGTWQSYTPTLTNITLGNGTMTAKYGRVGDTIVGRVRITAGTSTTYAAGNIGVSLPAAFQTDYAATDNLGNGAIDNGSGATRRLLQVIPTGTQAANLAYEGGTVTNTAPLALSTTTRIAFGFTYEQA